MPGRNHKSPKWTVSGQQKNNSLRSLLVSACVRVPERCLERHELFNLNWERVLLNGNTISAKIEEICFRDGISIKGHVLYLNSSGNSPPYPAKRRSVNVNQEIKHTCPRQ